ncbi:MAG: oxidative damage protection protein, partial [Myxococcota bacterium]
DEAGTVVNAGWMASGLPTEAGEPEGRSYRDLSRAGQPKPSVSEEPPAPEAQNQPDEEGMNRFASTKRRVNCVRRGKDLPGLKRRPYPGKLGERIFAEISAAAWDEWVEHSKMLINEYRINSADPEAMRLLMEQCEQFLYGGENVERPEGYVPQ